jgi:photosystem I subunit X
MLNSTLLLADIGPMTQAWSPTVAAVMVGCSVLGVLAAGGAKKAGPALVGGFTAAQLIGGASFGHLIGAGAVLGLTRLGII